MSDSKKNEVEKFASEEEAREFLEKFIAERYKETNFINPHRFAGQYTRCTLNKTKRISYSLSNTIIT